ncbi:MAG TPA: cytochrome c biogenesis protein CcsA [Thermoanaerobaculia bacterium]|nr:cytochrome c biogenesis protein CcsA [Thermoanaerobaculia bacterium]
MPVARPRLSTVSGLLGVVLLLAGSYLGLFVAPPERHMGDVVRIVYVHVPSAWISMLCYTFAFGFAIASLWTRRPRWDHLTTAAVEVGIVLNVLLLVQGMLFARPTWGIWWTWADVRLVFSFLMFLLFAGVLALRAFVDDPARRGTWTAIATITAFVDVPLVYYCVRWWRSLHQMQSTPETMDAAMKLPMRINAFAVLFLAGWFIARRAELERRRQEIDEVAEPAAIPRAGSIAGTGVEA